MTKTSPGATDSPPQGLRAAGLTTRSAIEDAARRLFAERGFEKASVRAIAGEAGVDPALVIRHFGSKEALFLRTVDTTFGIDALVQGPVETFGRRIVAYLLDPARPDLRQRATTLGRAIHLPDVREANNQYAADKFIAPLAARLRVEHPELRVALVVAQITGLLSLLCAQEEPTLNAADVEDIVALYGDAIQQLLTP